MGEARTYGYGRVSQTVKPSPYSPLHRASEIPGSPEPRRRKASHRRRAWSLAGLAVALLALAATLVLVSRVEKAAAPAPVAKPSTTSQPLPTLADDEAQRLPRSAIAVHRSAPRPRS